MTKSPSVITQPRGSWRANTIAYAHTHTHTHTHTLELLPQELRESPRTLVRPSIHCALFIPTHRSPQAGARCWKRSGEVEVVGEGWRQLISFDRTKRIGEKMRQARAPGGKGVVDVRPTRTRRSAQYSRVPAECRPQQLTHFRRSRVAWARNRSAPHYIRIWLSCSSSDGKREKTRGLTWDMGRGLGKHAQNSHTNTHTDTTQHAHDSHLQPHS
jgi:hypothetical protein